MLKRIINIVFFIFPVLLFMWVYAFFSTNPAERVIYLNGHDPLQALNFAKSLSSGQYSVLDMYHHGSLNRHLFLLSMGIYVLFYLICGKHLLLAYFLNICFFIVVFYIILYFGIKYILLYNKQHSIKLKAKKYTIICSACLYLFFSIITIILAKVKIFKDTIDNLFFLTFHTPAALISMLSLVIVFKYFACHRANNKKLRKYFFFLLILLLAGTLFEDFFVLIFVIVPIFVASCIMLHREKLKIIFTKSTKLVLFFTYLFYVGFTILIFVYFADRPLQLFRSMKGAPLHNFSLIILTFVVPLCMSIFFLICFSNIKIVINIKNFFRKKNILFSFFFIFFFVSLSFSILYFISALNGTKCDNTCFSTTTRGLHPTIFIALFLITFLMLKLNKVFLKYISLLIVFAFSIYAIVPFVNGTKMPSIVFNVKNSYISCYNNYHKNILKNKKINTLSSLVASSGLKLYINNNFFAINYYPNLTSGNGHMYSMNFPSTTTKINDFVFVNLTNNDILDSANPSKINLSENSKEYVTPKYNKTSYNGNEFLVAKCPGYTIYHSEKSFDRYTGYKIYNHFLPSGEQHIDFDAK